MPTNAFKSKANVRPRIQRCFFNWLDQNQHRLAIPLHIKWRSDQAVTFTFIGLTRALEMTLTHEIGIHVLKDEDWWDALIFFEAEPIKTDDGYICGYCKPEYIEPYPSREALWVNHLFEPFLAWVNETLPPENWLMLGQTDGGGARWAELHREKKDEMGKPNHVWIPVRLNP